MIAGCRSSFLHRFGMRMNVETIRLSFYFTFEQLFRVISFSPLPKMESCLGDFQAVQSELALGFMDMFLFRPSPRHLGLPWFQRWLELVMSRWRATADFISARSVYPRTTLSLLPLFPLLLFIPPLSNLLYSVLAIFSWRRIVRWKKWTKKEDEVERPSFWCAITGWWAREMRNDEINLQCWWIESTVLLERESSVCVSVCVCVSYLMSKDVLVNKATQGWSRLALFA